ncbi:LuxR C-terminal-related transcriptional regulator, partial [Streptomyces sp. NPDC003514]
LGEAAEAFGTSPRDTLLRVQLPLALPTIMALGELTARQRQIVDLAAVGLTNREIAEKLTLSVRTVGNHLYSAYARLGAPDRGALPWLLSAQGACSA